MLNSANESQRVPGSERQAFESAVHGASVDAACGGGGCLGEYSYGTIEAIFKANNILARGFPMLSTAIVGSTCMALDDVLADARAALGCRNAWQWVEYEAEAGRLTAQRCWNRAILLSRMATQLAEDSLFPLERHFFLGFDLLARKAS